MAYNLKEVVANKPSRFTEGHRKHGQIHLFIQHLNVQEQHVQEQKLHTNQ